MTHKNKFELTMKSAGEKLNFARATLQGPDSSIRDDRGFAYTANRILTANANFLDLGSSTMFSLNEALANGMSRVISNSKNNFSASDLNSVYDMDVIDVSIAATVASHGLSYIAMERAMKSVKQNIEFQKLVAVNTAAGFTAGQTAIDPRLAINPNIDLGRSGAMKWDATLNGAADATVTLNLNTPIVSGTTIIYWSNAGDGSDNVQVAFTSPAVKPVNDIETVLITDGSKIKSGTVDIKSGVISLVLATAATAGKLRIAYTVDRIAETTGANTLKLRPQLDSKEITAVENRVILQTSIEVQAQMNKIFRENSQYGVDIDYGKRAIDQIVQLYTYFIDVNIVRALWKGASQLPVTETINLSGYSTNNYTSFSATKNDRISLFVRKLTSSLLTRTGSPVTALICDEVGALMLASDNINFVEDAAFRQRRDGLIGTYNNIPVIRNVYLNGKASNPTYGLVLGIHKSLNGEAASVCFGDYLPPYSTIAAVNPLNPGELSQALFSQTATDCVVPEFIVKGEVVPYVG